MRSSTSGSWAAGRITVWPSARVAASIAFSVPMTDTNGKRTSVAAEAARAPSRSSSRCGTRSSAPSARIASTWRSTGRRPIRSPPGLLMITRPKRARSGPRSMKLARILAAASSGHEQPLDVARGDLVDVRRRDGRRRRRGRGGSRP